MSSITVHGLDEPMDRMIRQKAQQDNLSLNKTIKKLLAEALGITSSTNINHRDEFADLFGVWSDEEHKEFENNTGQFSTIDADDWK